jgi:hypothetical protein
MCTSVRSQRQFSTGAEGLAMLEPSKQQSNAARDVWKHGAYGSREALVAGPSAEEAIKT